MKTHNYLKQVREQYENYPYPERNPDDEKNRLYPPVTDCLDRVNYYCFGGKRNFSDDFKVLVAGGGTGDSTIFLAEQLRDFNTEIVYLDITQASMEVARQRAAVRGLENIQWIHGSVLDLPRLGLGEFDYINCTGVLHHLEDAQQGLAALNAVLKDGGAMAIMVYARYGRTAIYQVQELMRRINGEEPDLNVQVDNCRTILGCLPDTNWFNHSRKLFPDRVWQSSIELYDLFLHSKDRPYSIPELYDFVEMEGLHVLQLLSSGNSRGNGLYDPGSYITDSTILSRIRDLPVREQQAIAELMHRLMPKHTFYAAPEIRPPANVDNLSNIPYLGIHYGHDNYASLYSVVHNSGDNVTLRHDQTGYNVSFRKTPLTDGIFKYLDGKASLIEIFKKIMKSPSFRKHRPTIPTLHKEFKSLFSKLLVHEWMFLHNGGCEYPLTIQEMQERQNRA